MSELDDAFQEAESLGPDDRLRLIARLWESLPEEHWAAPSAMKLAELRRRLNDLDGERFVDVPWKIVRQMAGNQPAARRARLYSAPRRFDLATIFVVTLAYSLLFAFMSAMQFPPGASLVVGGFITLVGAGQALLFGGNRPRTASIMTGAGLALVASVAFWVFVAPDFMRQQYFALMTLSYVFHGAILGYVAGVMVGGVFLVADAVRRKFGRQAPDGVDKDEYAPDGRAD
jgi:putative addiction module component (TIGR02574 family)